jgi:hypothetical protein
MPAASPQQFYTCPGPMTDPGALAGLLAGLPSDLPSLCRAVQGLLVHVFWAERHGLALPDERKDEVQIREVAAKLARIVELDPRPLAEARPIERRLVGNCRDFSVLLASILKVQGVPARARCGFGTYFIPDHYEDHWTVEYWHSDQGRWVMVDSQLDELQCRVLRIDFDPCDLPAGRFVTGGQAWLACRAGQADPDKFGIFDMKGIAFIRGDLLRDVAALNNVEMLPWDFWGLLHREDADLSEDDLCLLDRAARLSVGGDESFAELRALYESDERLRVPANS